MWVMDRDDVAMGEATGVEDREDTSGRDGPGLESRVEIRLNMAESMIDP